MAAYRFTILGSGSSGGVPRIGGDWGACDPNEPKNRRTRCSLLVQRWEGASRAPEAATTVLIDTSPDFREQALAAGIAHVDGVLFSHDHADQTHGIDDLRVLAIAMRRQASVWMDAPTRASLMQRFRYCFEGAKGYPAILKDAGVLEAGAAVTVAGPGGSVAAIPLAQNHGPIPSLGFRFGGFAYSNDLLDMPEATLARLEGLEVWVVDALRYTPHPSHAHLERVLAWVERLKPKRTILTNLHVDMDFRTLERELPAGAEPAYDGLTVELEQP